MTVTVTRVCDASQVTRNERTPHATSQYASTQTALRDGISSLQTYTICLIRRIIAHINLPKPGISIKLHFAPWHCRIPRQKTKASRSLAEFSKAFELAD